ncbi:MAG: bactoprenol glucosyl transferase [Candidatus Saccharibacteria bacterium]|nr:bactoprenol glucosyl transferase [Candidatus Saccharibacteria bacterium]
MRKSNTNATAQTLYIVIPCYNEEAVIQETAKRLLAKLDKLIQKNQIDKKSRAIFVDDGSRDDTWKLIEALHKKHDLLGGVKLTRNRGHQNALLAGLMFARGNADVVISMDADLQDDINAIDDMLKAYNNGAEIVYGVRSTRAKDSILKRTTAQGFYRLMSRLGVDSIYNHADYRLLSKRALDELASFKEVNLFLRGIIPLLGFNTATVEYKRAERFAGESKYPFRKMLNFAIDGITSFSIKPLRLVASLGLGVSGVSFLIMLYSIVIKFMGSAVEGWTFTIISVWFIGGVQMLSIGIVGEYIGKIYNEVKARPRFIIEKEIH